MDELGKEIRILHEPSGPGRGDIGEIEILIHMFGRQSKRKKLRKAN